MGFGLSGGGRVALAGVGGVRFWGGGASGAGGGPGTFRLAGRGCEVSGTPEGYLGAEGPLGAGPSPELVAAGYRLETADARFLHRGLCLADLAHILELREIGLMPPEPARALCREVLDFLATPVGEFPYLPEYGDSYNSRERELERRLGSAAGWLPAGRTRREAGRIALRLALREGLLELHEAAAGLAVVLAARGRELAEVVWNDATYLQPAQPSSFGYYLAGFAEGALRDMERIRACYRRANLSPAGSGGVGGTLIPLNRERLAERLGFDAPTVHIRDGMWSADALADAAAAAAQAVITADRLAEDLEIFASPQFGYVRLAGGSSRASVSLPQKRNPYALAVIRGGAGTLIGRAAGLLVTQRTPSARTDNWLYAYGETVGAVEIATGLLRLAGETVRGMEVDTAALREGAGRHGSLAADLAERLTMDGGLDYRSAYRVVGRALAAVAEANGGGVWPGADDLRRAAGELGIGLRAADAEAARAAVGKPGEVGAEWLAVRDAPGSCAPHRVREHCRSAEERAAQARRWSEAARSRNEAAAERLTAAARSLAEGE